MKNGGTQDSNKDDFELVMGEEVEEELDEYMVVGVTAGSFMKGGIISTDVGMSNEEMEETQEFFQDEMDELVNCIGLEGFGEDLEDAEELEDRFVVDDSEDEDEKTDDEDDFYSEVISHSQDASSAEGGIRQSFVEDSDANSIAVNLNDEFQTQHIESAVEADASVLTRRQAEDKNQQDDVERLSNASNSYATPTSGAANNGNGETVVSAVDFLGVNQIWDSSSFRQKSEEQEDDQDSINTQPESVEERYFACSC